MLFYPRKKILGIQGVLPSRKKALARRISSVIMHVLPKEIRGLEKIPFVGEKIVVLVKSSIEKEINSLDNEKLEKIILTVVRKELGFITWMGGFLGFLIGLVQVLVIIL